MRQRKATVPRRKPPITAVEMSPPNTRVVRQTRVGKFIVSTIRRDEMMQRIDEMLGILGDIMEGDSTLENPDIVAQTQALSGPDEYETMVFPADDEDSENPTSFSAVEMHRFMDEGDARTGHQLIVDKWLDKQEKV